MDVRFTDRREEKRREEKRRKVSLLVTCFHAGFLLGFFFDPEDGGDIFL
jgi:hypothetical protein